MRTTEPLILTSTNEAQFWGFGDAQDFRRWLQQARPDLEEPLHERLVHTAAAFLERYGENGRRAVHQDIASLKTWLTRDTDNLGTQKATNVAYALHAACRGFGYDLAAVVMGEAPVEPAGKHIGGIASSSVSENRNGTSGDNLAEIALRKLEKAIQAQLEALETVEPESADVEAATRDVVENLRPATWVFLAGLIQQSDSAHTPCEHVPKEVCTAQDTVVQSMIDRMRTRRRNKR